MRNLVRTACALLVVAFPLTAASAAHADTPTIVEHVVNYNVTINVDTSGLMHARETIEYDFGSLQHHGIFRDFLVRENYTAKSGYDRVYRLKVSSVTQDGANAHYTTSTNGAYKEVKIGDANKLIGGTHSYAIDYTLQGSLNAFSDHDELYWNVVGNKWQVPIDHASISVDMPGRITNVACYQGSQGSVLPCDRASFRGQIASFGQDELFFEDGVTVAIAIPKGVVTPAPTPILEKRWNIDDAFARRANTLVPAGALAFIGVGLVLLLAWRRGRDRRYRGSAIDAAMGNTTGDDERVAPFGERAGPVEFVPPDGIRPGEVGVLVDEDANLLDITSTIVDLAARGYLKITELPAEGLFHRHHDYQLDRNEGTGSTEKLMAYERMILDSVFSSGDTVKLSELKYKFAPKIVKIRNSLLDDSLAKGWFRMRPDKTRANWHAIGILALVLSFVATFFVARYTTFGLVALAGVLAALVLMAAARHMPARTAKGTAMLSRVRGFRDLFTSEDAIREHFAEQHNIFAEYLPYAIVFGVTDKWANAFQGLDAQELGMSGWYSGTGNLNALAFASSMEHFGTSATGTMYASLPSSSGGSGFGGGGFSGGGGGGGGGGSW